MSLLSLTLHPNNKQKNLLAKHAGVARHANKLGTMVN
ncbi:MAG: helix-turn-helix domain-containing protein [Okeania sp. SIO3B5]|nr:helix-turn-helix domain-containing protein [Okeania sp. SIO3B5]